MNNHFTIRSFLWILLCIAPFGCNTEDAIKTTSIFPGVAEVNKFNTNHIRLGEFVYHHMKYYMATVDPYEFLNSADRNSFKEQLEEKGKALEENNSTYSDVLGNLLSQGVYSLRQSQILGTYHNDLETFLINEKPNLDKVLLWMLQQEDKIVADGSITPPEKNQILNIQSIHLNVLKYFLENHEISESLSAGKLSAACDFWAQAFCYLGTVSSYIGIATAIVGGSGPLAVISAAIGAIVGTYNAITTCPCNKNVCEAFKGLSFDYKCYSPGQNLLFRGWGHGNIAPTSYRYRYFKNGNWCTTCNFVTHITQNSYDYLLGSEISAHSVTSVGLTTENICAGTPKVSDHGMWTLSELGKPYGVVSGPSTFSTADASYQPTFTYYINGPLQKIQGLSLQWELIPSGYPDYSATGYITGGTNSSILTVHWNSTAGMATLKCTATSSCSTIIYYYNIHIYAAGGGYY